MEDTYIGWRPWSCKDALVVGDGKEEDEDVEYGKVES